MKFLSKVLIFVALVMSSIAFHVVCENPKLEYLRLNSGEVFLKVGQSDYLQVEGYPHQADMSSAVWASSDSNVVTVSDTGRLEGINMGTANVIVMLGDISASCKVTVLPIEVTNLHLSAKYDTIAVNEEMSITCSLEPSEATIQTISWTSSNPNVASVDQEGNVKGLAEGNTVIYATAHNGLNKAWNLTVKQEIEVEEIILRSSVTIIRHKTTQMTYSLFPNNATKGELVWEIIDTSIASVNEQGVVKGIKQGTTTIKVTTKNGKTDTCTIIVEEIPAHSIFVNHTDFYNLYEGKSVQIRIINKYPSNSTYVIEDATFTSYNTDVATVSETGLVTIVGKGSARILVTLGDCIDIIHFTVK